jgi:hypothetical protein
MAVSDPPPVDIAFDCLPLRSLGRLDVPLDASDALRRRAERIKAALAEFGAERTYYLYNARCIFHFANSEIDGACRFEFEGALRTDAGDRQCRQTQLDVRLSSETCGGVPADVEAWLVERVREAVRIEFDRFIAAGQLAERTAELGTLASLSELGGLAGLGV